jgi:hypothetical protein
MIKAGEVQHDRCMFETYSDILRICNANFRRRKIINASKRFNTSRLAR